MLTQGFTNWSKRDFNAFIRVRENKHIFYDNIRLRIFEQNEPCHVGKISCRGARNSDAEMYQQLLRKSKARLLKK